MWDHFVIREKALFQQLCVSITSIVGLRLCSESLSKKYCRAKFDIQWAYFENTLHVTQAVGVS